MFVELMPMLKERTLLITVARLDEKLKVNVIPAKAKEGEDQALTTPLTYTGSLSHWENAYFASEFTHPSGAVRLTTHPGGFLGLWSHLAGRKQSFPVKFLADSKQTLQEFVQRRGEG